MLWFVLRSPPSQPGENMALDEALLETAPARAQPVLRFYSWSQPAASFGYFQRYAEVAGWTTLRPLIRRPTAGGLVPHEADWTYSLVFPPAHEWYATKAIEGYRRLHKWIQRALARLQHETALAPAARKEIPGQCFAGAEQFDLLWRGRKLAGAAQRRTRRGLLIQGSVQPPGHFDRREWESAMLRIAEADFGAEWGELPLEPALVELAQTLAREKYSRPSYNQKR